MEGEGGAASRALGDMERSRLVEQVEEGRRLKEEAQAARRAREAS